MGRCPTSQCCGYFYFRLYFFSPAALVHRSDLPHKLRYDHKKASQTFILLRRTPKILFNGNRFRLLLNYRNYKMYSDIKIAHSTLSFYSLFSVLPFEFDSMALELNVVRSKLKTLLFLLATVNAYFATFYKLLTFVQTILILSSDNADQVSEVHLSIHFVLLSGYVCMMFRGIVIYLVHPEVIVSLFNWCSQSVKGMKQSTRESKMRAYLFFLIANGQVGTNAFFLLLYIFTCHVSPQFVYASVSEEYRSLGIQLGLAFIDLYSFMYVNSLGCVVLFVQLLFFARIFDACQSSVMRLR